MMGAAIARNILKMNSGNKLIEVGDQLLPMEQLTPSSKIISLGPSNGLLVVDGVKVSLGPKHIRTKKNLETFYVSRLSNCIWEP